MSKSNLSLPKEPPTSRNPSSDSDASKKTKKNVKITEDANKSDNITVRFLSWAFLFRPVVGQK